MSTDDDVVQRLRVLLGEVDMQTTSGTTTLVQTW